MSHKVLLCAGYAVLMWGAAHWLRTRARKAAGESWIAKESAAFIRAIALVPLLAGEAMLWGAMCLERSALATLLLAPLAVGLAWEARRGWVGWRVKDA